MSKKRRYSTRAKHKQKQLPPNPFIWEENGEIHALTPGLPPTAAELEEQTRKYREEIKKSPLWQKMIDAYGKEKAEELLQECRVELRP